MQARFLYDLHGHFLPGIDDGCKTVEESVELLRRSYAYGVRAMFATPHYYPSESVDEFLTRRANAAERLYREMELGSGDFPVLCLGAEVAYHTGLIYEENLDRLCYGNSNYLLLEMPFSRWSPEVLRDVFAIRSARGLVPVLAHIERYFALQEKSAIQELLDSDVLIQMNAEYFLDPKTRRKGLALLKHGAVQLLGSDCHNMTRRPPNLGPAVQYMEKHGLEEALETITLYSQEILREGLKRRP